MRNAFAEALYRVATRDPRIYVVVADISPAGAMTRFAQEFPERFINTGVAEQAMIGICAGLALRGCRPFAYTIAPFALYRPFEQVRDDLCYQNLPVTVVGMGAGVLYSTLGGTHHTIEDVSIACSLPNMTVIAPCDPHETIAAVEYCAKESKGPVYLRIGKVGEQIFTDAREWRFGKLAWIKRGADFAVLTYGPIIRRAYEVVRSVEEQTGSPASLISCSTLKPLDVEGIKEVLRTHSNVLVVEEHVPHGGLLAALKGIAWDANARTQIYAATLDDKFVHSYGSHEDVLRAYGL